MRRSNPPWWTPARADPGAGGSLAFVVFAGRLWGTLREAEGAPAWLAAIFTQAGAGLEPSVAAALYAAASASFGLFSAFAGLFIGLAAVVILQAGVLPRWLGWLGVAVLVPAVFGVAVAEVGFLAFPLVLLWMVAASYATAPASAREAARVTREALGRGVGAGLWGTLELTLLGAWLIGVGWLLRREWPRFAGLALLSGIGMVASSLRTGATGRTLPDVSGPLDLVIVLLIVGSLVLLFVWLLWLAISLWRAPPPGS